MWIPILLVVLVVGIKLIALYLAARADVRKTQKVFGKTAAGASGTFHLIRTATESHPKAKKVLVTGASTLLGRRIVAALQQQLGPEKVSIATFDREGCPEADDPTISVMQGDLCNTAHLKVALRQCHAVIHAHDLGPDAAVKASEFDWVNHQGLTQLIEVALAQDVQVLLYASSILSQVPESGVAEGSALTHDARHPPAPCGHYAASKAAAERMVMACNSHAIRTAVLRTGWVYGTEGGQVVLEPCGTGEVVPPPHVRVPLAWVEDVARAHVTALKQLLWPETPRPKLAGRAVSLAHLPADTPAWQEACQQLGVAASSSASSSWLSRLLGFSPPPGPVSSSALSHDVVVEASGLEELLPGWQPSPWGQALGQVRGKVAGQQVEEVGDKKRR
mmetsp:Transcript_26441/g.57680  ORF Transcript_26441/g.57680 Transcript_26441/m.57680 type:complete len:391 (+) Transcript_26441:125-1297(+)